MPFSLGNENNNESWANSGTLVETAAGTEKPSRVQKISDGKALVPNSQGRVLTAMDHHSKELPNGPCLFLSELALFQPELS